MEKKWQNKRLGQVFLKDQNNLNRIVAAAELTEKDSIVEVGCGEGWMSYQLAKLAGELYILEIDSDFLAMTQERLQEFSTVHYLLGDALKTTLAPVTAKRFKMVANIPYQISAPLIKMLISENQRLERAVLLVQKEFAKKLVAPPGSELYTSFTLYTQYHFEITYLFDVSRQCFRPVPRVDSAVVLLRPRAEPLFPLKNKTIFFDMIRSAFSSRRKTLVNCLANSPYLTIDPQFKTAPFLLANPNIRGEVLSLDQYYQLFREIEGFILPNQIQR